ncbi:LAMI_0C07998g1_1 [Lachancea mirantina]|uniref:LAMI_0C07998g1_1 n=1 Tax=Lachancea mirantina TaxID=1230905 RepID=A0A1G4J4L6_9SACH|nr:LAMI_0C07998g1_1 [Lachancea mirantina]
MSEADGELATNISEDFGFKPVGKFPLLESYEGKVPFGRVQNFAVCTKRKLFVAATCSRVVVGSLQQLRDGLAGGDTAPEIDFTASKTDLNDVVYVGFTAGSQQAIFVTLTRGFGVYDFGTAAWRETQTLDLPGDVLQASVVPGVADLFMVLTHDQLYAVQTSGSAHRVCSGVASFDVARGQYAVLRLDGSVQVRQFETPETIAQFETPEPLKPDLADHTPVAIKWLSKHDFFVVFGQDDLQDDASYDHKMFVVHHANDNTPVYKESYDIAPAFGTVRRNPCYYGASFHNLLQDSPWIYVVTSACASELTLFDDSEVIQPNQDADRAVLPISQETDNDTNPVGFALDLVCDGDVLNPCSGVDVASNLPILLVLNDEGTVLAYALFHSQAIKNNTYTTAPTLELLQKNELALISVASPSNDEPKPDLSTSQAAAPEEQPFKNTEAKTAFGVPISSSPFNATSSSQPSFGQMSFTKSTSDQKPAFGISNSDQQPAFGKPAFGQSTFGHPAFGQSTFGQAGFGKQTSNPPKLEHQPSSREPSQMLSTQTSPNKITSSPFGQPSFNQSPFGKPVFGSSPFGQQTGAQPAFGASTFGSQDNSQAAFGASTFGQKASHQPAFGQLAFGQKNTETSAFGQPAFGKPTFGQSKPETPAFGTFDSAALSKMPFGAPKTPLDQIHPVSAEGSSEENQKKEHNKPKSSLSKSDGFSAFAVKGNPFSQVGKMSSPFVTPKPASQGLPAAFAPFEQTSLDSPFKKSTASTTDNEKATDSDESKSSSDLESSSSDDLESADQSIEPADEDTSADTTTNAPAAETNLQNMDSLTERIKKIANITPQDISDPFLGPSSKEDRQFNTGTSAFAGYSKNLDSAATPGFSFAKINRPSITTSKSSGAGEQATKSAESEDLKEQEKINQDSAAPEITDLRSEGVEPKKPTEVFTKRPVTPDDAPVKSTEEHSTGNELSPLLPESSSLENTVSDSPDSSKEILDKSSSNAPESSLSEIEDKKTTSSSAQDIASELTNSKLSPEQNDVPEKAEASSETESFDELEDLRAELEEVKKIDKSAGQFEDHTTQTTAIETTPESENEDAKHNVAESVGSLQENEPEAKTKLQTEEQVAASWNSVQAPPLYSDASLTNYNTSSSNSTMRRIEMTSAMVSAELVALSENVESVGKYITDLATEPAFERTEKTLYQNLTWRLSEIQALIDISGKYKASIETLSSNLNDTEQKVKRYNDTELGHHANERHQIVASLDQLQSMKDDRVSDLASLSLPQYRIQRSLKVKLAKAQETINQASETLQFLKLCNEEEQLKSLSFLSKTAKESLERRNLLEVVQDLSKRVSEMNLSQSSLTGDPTRAFTAPIAEMKLRQDTRRQIGRVLLERNA